MGMLTYYPCHLSDTVTTPVSLSSAVVIEWDVQAANSHMCLHQPRQVGPAFTHLWAGERDTECHDPYMAQFCTGTCLGLRSGTSLVQEVQACLLQLNWTCIPNHL